MKYFLIAGEASGDLHGSNLMRALKREDTEAEFCFFGGDRMSAVGGTRLRHYRNIAYMGFVPVLLHLRTILHAMSVCRHFILRWHPDVVILIDYPGFNLSIAKFVHKTANIPVYYYISPKIWAWKEHRIFQIRENVTEMFSILPFEVPFYEEKHHYPIHYVGNPSVDEILNFKAKYQESFEQFTKSHNLSDKPVIALLPGSRRQEIKDNLRRMCLAAESFLNRGYQIVVAGVSDLSHDFYEKHIHGLKSVNESPDFHILQDSTNQILSHAEAALVTSGTATLETALFNVPQVVCYYAPFGLLVRFLKKKFLHVPYVSLVNLIVGRLVVPELVGDQVNPAQIEELLKGIVRGGTCRNEMMAGYREMAIKLGPTGAPARAAKIMASLLGQSFIEKEIGNCS